ncbi:MAG: polysaccharide biosynthesis protein [Lachnospiraceae bacterium]|nr:polysaccharide biosynthesis protein [Lachnospiraceae bacterium]
MNKKNSLITGTLILTITGFISRIIGFFYRIYLSRLLGSEGMGLYHLIFPIFGVCFSLSCAGIQTALSKFVAAETACRKSKNVHAYFNCAMTISLALSFSCSAVLYNFSSQIAAVFLHEERCAILLEMLSFCIPLTAIHACIHGYYYGIHKAAVPAVSQLVEQFVRITFMMLTVSLLTAKSQSISVIHAVYGLIAGEAGASVFCTVAFILEQKKQRATPKPALLSRYGKHATPKPALLSRSEKSSIAADKASLSGYTVEPYGVVIRKLINLFIPLTSTRLTISLLQSIESALIPAMLIYYGYSRKDALSIYGVLTGMALPFILFPTAITNSMAVMLLPAVSQANASDNKAHIEKTTNAAITVSLYIGFLFAGLFIALGQSIGSIIYADENAGSFIVILAWLCPFLYISTTMSGTINGLGKSKTAFINTALSLSIRLLFVVLIIPMLGIKAYLYGILASEIALSLLHYFCIKKQTGFNINPVNHLFKPMAAMAGALITVNIFSANADSLPVPETFRLCLCAGWFGLFYLFASYALNIKKS